MRGKKRTIYGVTCGRRAVLEQLRLGHVCSAVSGVVCPILTLFWQACRCLLLDTFESWGLTYLYFIFWGGMNLEMESIIQWFKHPPDIAWRIKSVRSHPFPGGHVNALLELLSISLFPRDAHLGLVWWLCGYSGRWAMSDSLRSLIFWQRCLWGWRRCASQGRYNLAIYRSGFSSEFIIIMLQACSPLPPPNKIHFLIHDLIPHIIFQPSCMIGSRLCKTVISLPAQRLAQFF